MVLGAAPGRDLNLRLSSCKTDRFDDCVYNIKYLLASRVAKPLRMGLSEI